MFILHVNLERRLYSVKQSLFAFQLRNFILFHQKRYILIEEVFLNKKKKIYLFFL